jgi:hypothetical protein
LEYAEEERKANVSEGEEGRSMSEKGGRGGTPPKRARIDEPPHLSLPDAKLETVASPKRMVKRRSEELDDAKLVLGTKRQRQTPPPTSDSPSEGGDVVETEGERQLQRQRQREAMRRAQTPGPGAIDVEGTKLYVLEDEDEDV